MGNNAVDSNQSEADELNAIGLKDAIVWEYMQK